MVQIMIVILVPLTEQANQDLEMYVIIKSLVFVKCQEPLFVMELV